MKKRTNPFSKSSSSKVKLHELKNRLDVLDKTRLGKLTGGKINPKRRGCSGIVPQ